ncbi:hypothetical protein Gohar_017092 [Gossypium harknessii]|uniref:Uncharacterized protein n=1 Tax=Gossypium harknessii TaxID=34285 RepID=A0A7J9G5G9_9ROSI|nr:hypothetical protein [Gossypium harknessii]
MEAVLALEKPRSWKDYLVGTGFQAEGKAATAYNFDDDGDFELLYADVVQSSVNDIPSINFSELGPWIVYGKYLTVQPWSMLFKALLECGHGMDSPSRSARTYVQKENPMGNRGMIRRVVKLDFNTDNGVRERFARMTVYLNLKRL